VVPGTTAAYLIDHSSFVYIVDPAGQLRLMFPFGMSIDDMVHDIRLPHAAIGGLLNMYVRHWARLVTAVAVVALGWNLSGAQDARDRA